MLAKERRMENQGKWLGWLAVGVWVVALVGPLAAEEKELQAVRCGTVKQLHALGDIWLAGQPSADDFAKLKERGIRTVLNLREKSELKWDEGEVVRGKGMKYVSLPFRAPQSLTDTVFDKARAVINDKEGKPVLIHCGSANRVGAIWLVHRVLDGNLTYDKALAEAKKVGLRSAAYEARAREYIRKNEKQ
jgi:uncharacterized protein (TIGR01244 family)